jgi:hypothetical protein
MERGSDRLDADTLTAGYAAIGRGPEGQDDYYWVCAECFKDFRARFEWKRRALWRPVACLRQCS